MSETIEIRGHEGTIVLILAGYERDLGTDRDDANWLRSDVTATVGRFNGAFRCAVMTFDLVRFFDDLKAALTSLSGRIAFRSSEDDINLEIEFGSRGTATITGTLKPQESLQASLSFTIESDQSFLAKTLRQLDSALRRFPVRQAQ